MNHLVGEGSYCFPVVSQSFVSLRVDGSFFVYNRRKGTLTKDGAPYAVNVVYSPCEDDPEANWWATVDPRIGPPSTALAPTLEDACRAIRSTMERFEVVA